MRKRRNVRRLIRISSVLLAFIVVLKLMSATIPFVSDAAGKAAVISACLALPEGGQTLLYDEIDKSDEDNVSQSNADDSKSNPTENISSSSQTAPTAQFSQDEINKYSNQSGQIIHKKYEAGNTPQYVKIADHAYIRNMTDLDNQVVVDANNSSPAFKLKRTSEPQVLIYHTHTTEAYELTSRDFYDASYPTRSLDNQKNVVRVGDEITRQLEAAGIGVIHDTTVHDNPSYNGAYDRSKETVEKDLEKYPSIKVCLDIHRDAIGEENGPRYAPTTEINGRQAAQLMIISGCDDGSGKYPDYQKNLAFAALLERQTEKEYPSLTRPVSFKYKYYNQSLTPGTLLVEIGGHANSVDEAVYTGWLFGKSLSDALLSITED